MSSEYMYSISIYIYIYICVCMYVCTYVRRYVRTYVRMYVCMYYMYVHIHIHTSLFHGSERATPSKALTSAALNFCQDETQEPPEALALGRPSPPRTEPVTRKPYRKKLSAYG